MKCQHCGIHFDDEERVCPMCGARAGSKGRMTRTEPKWHGKPRNVSMNKLAYNLSAGGEYRLSPLVGISAKLNWIVTSSESYSVRYHGQKWQVESPELSGGGGCFSQLSLLFGMNLHF